MRDVDTQFVQNICHLVGLVSKHTLFYNTPGKTLRETCKKIDFLKHVIENEDGYRVVYVEVKPVERESDLPILFKLDWEGSPTHHFAGVAQ